MRKPSPRGQLNCPQSQSYQVKKVGLSILFILWLFWDFIQEGSRGIEMVVLNTSPKTVPWGLHTQEPLYPKCAEKLWHWEAAAWWAKRRQRKLGEQKNGFRMLQMVSRKTGSLSLVSDPLDWLLAETKPKRRQSSWCSSQKAMKNAGWEMFAGHQSG